MLAFQEKDAEFFFGRETFVNGLVRVVQQQPLVAIIGSSGSGKSSVVLAGLIPKLREAGNWLIESFRPNKQPFYELAATLINQLEPELGKTDKTIKAKELSQSIRKHGFTGDVSAILKDNPGKRLLLVVDQFEELYTGCADTEQQQFVDVLLAAVESASPYLTLVLTLRADFYSYVVNYPPFTEALNKYPAKNITLMKAEEMQAAIELPAKTMGVKLEEGLTQRILDDVKQEPGNLPLLEFALTQLWEKQSRGLLTHQAYSEIGGVAKALSNHAEAVYSKLSEEEQKQAQRLFVQLVRPGEGTEDTRRLATPAEVGNWELVTRLADARLVVTGRNEQTKEETVEVVHEALIREWGRLRGWMESDRTFRTWQERLRVLMRQWEATSKDDGALLRGASLLEAQRWWREHRNDLQAEKSFIIASLNLRKQQRMLGGIASLGIFVALALLTIQWWQEKLEQAYRNNLIEKISNVQRISGTEHLEVTSLAVTDESVWMTVTDRKTSERAGLLRYNLKNKNKPLIQYRSKDSSNLKDDRVTAILIEGKDIWVGVQDQGVLHSSIDSVKFNKIFFNKNYISSIVQDKQNRLWVGTYNGLYLVLTEEQRQNETIEKSKLIDLKIYCPQIASDSEQPQIEQMAIAPNGSVLWIATNNGLVRWNLAAKHNSAECYPKPKCNQPNDPLDSKPNSLTAIGFDSNGSPWVGTTEGFVKLLQNDNCWFSSKLLAKSYIQAIAALPNRFFLVVSLTSGAFLYHPRTNEGVSIPLNKGGVENIYAIQLKADNHLWIGTNQGLFHAVQPIRP